MKIHGLILALTTFVFCPATVLADANADLLTAARKGELEGVKAALAAGADVNAKTPYGVTSLMYTADRGNLDIVRLLLDRGADLNAKDTFYGGTAVVGAAMSKHSEIVQLLLEKGAEGAEDILQMSASQGPASVVKAVIASKKASLEALSAALAAAKATDQQETVEALQAVGAKVPEAKAAVSVKPETLQSYAGTYKSSQIGMEISFVVADSSLKGSVTDQPTITYSPTSDDTFESVEFPGIKIIFKRADGPVPSLTVEQGGGSFVFDRVAEKPAAPAATKSESKPAAQAKPKEAEKDAKVPILAKNWPSFRGMGATGVADGQNPPLHWNVSKGENVAWKAEIPGLAHSCPIVWGDKVFVTTAISSDLQVAFRHGLYGDVDSVATEPAHKWQVYCLDKRSGSILWERKAHEGVPKVKRHTKGSHANCTPATDGKYLAVSFAGEGLYCYDLDGNLLWKRDVGLLDAGFFFDPDDQWGFGSSPIIHKDKVILQCDVQDKPFIAAFDVKGGKEIWRTPREEICSWGSPTVYEGSTRAELLTNGTKAVRSYDPATGKELWKLSGNAEITVPTPFVAHDMAFFASGYSPVQPIFAVKLGGTGDITLSGEADKNDFVAWSKKRGGPYMPTPIVYGDFLYTCGNNGVLACYNAKTGEQVYKSRVAEGKGGAFTASPVAADGKLYFTSEDGDIFVVKAGPEYELLATNPVGEVCMATPAISDGMIFVRGQHHVFGIGSASRAASEPRP